MTDSTRQPLVPDDLKAAAAWLRGTLTPFTDQNWSVNARDLDWSCLATARHVVDALLIYTGSLAARAQQRRQWPVERCENREYTASQRLGMIEGTAAILAAVADGTPPETIAFHSSGMTDREGFLAMGCSEILAHGFDIASALGAPFDPPRDLAARVTARLFPWTPLDGDAWEALLWSNGRIALPDRPRIAEIWGWHPMPLSEWNGEQLFDN